MRNAGRALPDESLQGAREVRLIVIAGLVNHIQNGAALSQPQGGLPGSLNLVNCSAAQTGDLENAALFGSLSVTSTRSSPKKGWRAAVTGPSASMLRTSRGSASCW